MKEDDRVARGPRLGKGHRAGPEEAVGDQEKLEVRPVVHGAHGEQFVTSTSIDLQNLRGQGANTFVPLGADKPRVLCDLELDRKRFLCSRSWNALDDRGLDRRRMAKASSLGNLEGFESDPRRAMRNVVPPEQPAAAESKEIRFVSGGLLRQ